MRDALFLEVVTSLDDWLDDASELGFGEKKAPFSAVFQRIGQVSGVVLEQHLQFLGRFAKRHAKNPAAVRFEIHKLHGRNSVALGWFLHDLSLVEALDSLFGYRFGRRGLNEAETESGLRVLGDFDVAENGVGDARPDVWVGDPLFDE